MARTSPHRHRPWTAEEVARLEKLAKGDLTADAIGRRLGRTSHAVRSKAYKRGIALGRAEPTRPASQTWSSIAAAGDYFSAKVVEGVTAYTRRNTGQVMLLAAAVGCVLGAALGGGNARARGVGVAGDDRPGQEADDAAAAAVSGWESEGGAIASRS